MTTKIYISEQKMKSAIFRFRNGGNDKTATVNPINDCGIKAVKVTSHKRSALSSMDGTGKFTFEFIHDDGSKDKYVHMIPNMSVEDKTVGIVCRIEGQQVVPFELIGV